MRSPSPVTLFLLARPPVPFFLPLFHASERWDSPLSQRGRDAHPPGTRSSASLLCCPAPGS